MEMAAPSRVLGRIVLVLAQLDRGNKVGLGQEVACYDMPPSTRR